VPAGLLASALVGLWTGLLWHHWVDRGHGFGPRRAVLAGSGGVATAILAAPTVWSAALDGYGNDSFFTLAPWPRAGLAALSAALILGLFSLSAAKSAAIHRAGAKLRAPPLAVFAADLLASAALMAIALGLSPQIYYSYYRLVVPGLPAQWQLRGWATVESLLRQASLAPDASLAHHLVGLTLWSLLIMTGWFFVLAHPQVRRRVSSRLAGLGAALLCGLIYGLS